MLDITERRHAEEQLRKAEARYRAIVEHVPAAVYVDRPDDTMQSVYVSPQIEQIMGVSPQRFLDEPDLWLDLMTPRFREEIRRDYLEAIEEGRSWRGEYQIVTPDGREVWVHDETNFVRDENGAPLFLQGVMFDVTDRKLAEQALRDSERREREAAERLRALDEMKNTFLAAVSHELRSPLTSILGLSLTLEQQRLSVADRRDLTRRVAQNARKLDRLLKDLLDIDRLSRGNVTPQLRLTDVGALARGTVESLELGERRVAVEADAVSIAADGPKVERIVENLVMNAVRHTGADVPISVRVWAGGGGAFLAVEDEGPGVPEELQAAIFEPFRQGPTASAHSPGTGIGLSLVAMFTELHGGRAWVEDREGGGASFRVFLPGGSDADADREERRASRRRPRTADAARAG
jgi:PAS domain S-box-containing protein